MKGQKGTIRRREREGHLFTIQSHTVSDLFDLRRHDSVNDNDSRSSTDQSKLEMEKPVFAVGCGNWKRQQAISNNLSGKA